MSKEEKQRHNQIKHRLVQINSLLDQVEEIIDDDKSIKAAQAANFEFLANRLRNYIPVKEVEQ
jgi:hypothetical protein